MIDLSHCSDGECVIINTVGSYRVFGDTVSGRLRLYNLSVRCFSVSEVCASVHQFICAAKCESDSSSHTTVLL